MGKLFIISPFGLINVGCIRWKKIHKHFITAVLDSRSFFFAFFCSCQRRSYQQQQRNNMHDMAMIYNRLADCRIWHHNAGSQLLQVPISVSREITLQEEHFCCQKIVIWGFNGVLKCNDPRWSKVKKRLGNYAVSKESLCAPSPLPNTLTHNKYKQ